MSSDQHDIDLPAAEGQGIPAQAEHLNIKVTDNNNEMVFRIKKSTKLEKLMGSFCDHQGKNIEAVRFFFEGRLLLRDQTPGSHEMEDGDTIEVYCEQRGGSQICSGAPIPRSRAGSRP